MWLELVHIKPLSRALRLCRLPFYEQLTGESYPKGKAYEKPQSAGLFVSLPPAGVCELFQCPVV